MTRPKPLKAFFASTLMLPSDWVGARQGDVLAFAESKADLERLLIDAGAPGWASTEIPKQARWWRDALPGGSTWGKVIACGAIDPSRRGAYAAPMSMVNGAVVVELVDGGALPIAHIHYDGKYGGRGLYAESIREKE